MSNTTVAILTLLAIAFSPLIAVLVTVYLQNRKEERSHKLTLLGTLIGLRHAPTSDESIRALNLIDVVFHDAPRARELWHEYFGMLNNEGLNNPIGWGQRQKKNLEMITEMARVLGYGKAITHLDVDRVYYPIALEQRAKKDAAISDAVLQFFTLVQRLAAKGQLPDLPTGPTVTSPPKPPQLPGA
jgi:flagellar biosynthesis protein FliP